jgi:hypothetical protein
MRLLSWLKKKLHVPYVWNFLTRQELSATQKGIWLTENNLLRNLRMKYNAGTPHFRDVPTRRRREHTDRSMLGAFVMNRKRRVMHSGQLANAACESNNEDEDTSCRSLVWNPLTSSKRLFRSS